MDPKSLSLTPEQEAFLIDFEPPAHCRLVAIWLENAIPKDFTQTVFDEKRRALEAAEKAPPPDRPRMEYMAERAHFLQVTDKIEAQTTGPDWLWTLQARRIIEERLREMNGHFFQLHAFSIVANAVYFLADFETQLAHNQSIAHPKPAGLVSFLRNFKGSSATSLERFSNQKDGLFWAMPHTERRIERAEHFFAAVDFILQRPVRVNLCEHWRMHDGAWIEPRLLQLFD